MGKKRRKSPNWSELPLEILHKIGESIGSSIFALQFRAVCKSWRSSMFLSFPRTQLSHLSPILPIKVPAFIGHFDCRFLALVANSSLMIQPSNGPFKGSSFLVIVDEINPCVLSARDPVLSSMVRSRWGVRRSGSRSLNLLETRVSVLDQGCGFRTLSVRRNDCENGVEDFEVSSNGRGFSYKTVMVSNPCCGDDLLAMVVLQGCKAAVVRVRTGEWKLVCDGYNSRCYDIVKFKGEIYGINHRGRAFFIDYDFNVGHVNIVMVARLVEGSRTGSKRLVVDSSSKELYMVVERLSSSNLAFSVYKLNEDGQVWDKVANLGDRMFFVGVDVSFCASVSDFPGLSTSCLRSDPGNCIFFSKGSFPACYESGDRFLFGVGKDGTGMNIGHYHLGNQCATGLLEPAYDIMFSALILLGL